MTDPLWNPRRASAAGYDRRWERMAAASEHTHGEHIHGEADFVESLGPTRVLDAGCGTGRVAIELARRGIDVVGVDSDASMVARAQRKAPALRWIHADLTTVRLDSFDTVVLAGNVMLFLRPSTDEVVVRNLARLVAPGGVLVNGFQLMEGRLTLRRYDELAFAAGLVPAGRWGTWDREPFVGGDYAVSLHRRPVLR